MKRFCTFFVIFIALSCWISVADAQKPTVDIRIEPETPANPTVGDTLNYLVVISNSQNVIGFRLIYAIPLNLSETVSHATYGDTEEQIGDSVDAAGRITGTWESSTRYPDRSIRYVAGFALNNVSAGAGEIRVTGTLSMHPRAPVNPGRTVNVDVSLPITIAHPEPLPPPLPEPAEPVAVPASDFAALAQPSVRLVYFLPNDRPARPERIEALRQLIKDTQAFFADEMERHGYGRKTFRVETDRSGEPIVHRFQGRFNERHYYEVSNGWTDFKVWSEFFPQVNDLQHVYLIAIDQSYELLGEGESCGLGGVTFSPANADTDWFFGSAAVRHRHETPGEEVSGGSAILPAAGFCFYDTRGYLHPLRVITHELAHTFGLDHDFSDPDSAVGGSGFRFSERDTEWLSVSRFFNSNPASENTPGNIQLISTPTYSTEGITLHFEVTDADGLHQAQLLVPEDGSWGPWKLIGSQALDGHTQRVEFLSSALTSVPERVMLQFMDDLGNITFATFLVDIASVLPPPKVVSVPDRNLRQAIRAKLGLASEDTLTDRAMKNLGSLYVDDRKITNIAGLEYATQLRELGLGRNQIKNYAPLARLPQLKTLHLWGNNISDLNVFPPMPQLELLDLNWNQISDLSPLAGFTNLKELWLQGNNLTDTSTLFKLHNGVFPADEAVQVTKEQDNGGRAYILLTFQSLDLKVRVNPEVKVYTKHLPPAPIVHVDAAQRPPLYWIDTDNGTLQRLVGDEVENLVSNVRNATGLAVDLTAGKLYWTEKTGDRTGRIRRANLDGTNVKLVKNLTSLPLDIALDAANGKIYVTNVWGKVQRLNVDGSNFQPNLITGLENPKDIAVDTVNGKVYWIETHERSGNIRKANLDGSNVQPVKALTSVPLGIALDVSDSKIYLTNAYGKVQRLKLDGSNFQPNLITGLTDPKDIAVDIVNGKVYWTETGSIRRASLLGENIEDVATNLDSPATLVLGMLLPSDTPSGTDHQETAIAADVNQDKKVNKTDLLLVVTALGENPPANPSFDVNADGAVNIADVLLVIEALDDPVAAAAPSFGETRTALDPARLAMQIDILRAESDGSLKYEHAIAFFQGLLASIRPTETSLLANYPNPFNPETWIPYQLAAPADVSIAIYAADGRLVRTLELGHQSVGLYESRSRAAYWDGRNQLGEPVASGVYFYTLTAGNFAQTRRMLILK